MLQEHGMYFFHGTDLPPVVHGAARTQSTGDTCDSYRKDASKETVIPGHLRDIETSDSRSGNVHCQRIHGFLDLGGSCVALQSTPPE